ncbi:addiction module protein [Candidatus Woesearchaeota archaeon]|jgi:putative addiction module component (TIGR02574 family)|nr:addiction module protein [Candidatus Woesearchaeota archaeon]
MNLKRIKEEALHLPENERAELVQKILLSIDTPTEEEIEQDWLLEATRRSQELDAGLVQAIPASEVRKKAQALLR